MIRIETVDSRKQFREFIRFPLLIYAKISPWVPPIWSDEMTRLDPKQGPFFDHSDAQLFLARDNDGNPLGRIAAIKFNGHLEIYKDKLGFFGFFECINDQAVADQLLKTAKKWLNENGLIKMRGPASFTINEQIGLLIENFDEPPTLLTTWNPPYYQKLLETAGLVKAEDLLAREVVLSDVDPQYLNRITRIGSRNNKISIRKANLDKIENEIDILVKVYGEAWNENWGAVPISHNEFIKLVLELKPFLLPDCTLIAEYDGIPVGVCVAIPDINVAIKACNGKLGPLGLIRFMLARRRTDIIRGVVGGVLKPYRKKGIESAFGSIVLNTLIGSRYKRIEFSWMLESNFRVHRVLDSIGAQTTKRWRVYEIDL
ncbi:MAG: N-acetyltransferase [Verrucomicrobiota bacterium]|nr:N-acetyltransferase [Verrucomicrobiota bacterium]